MSAWTGRDTTPTLLSNAWRIRSVLCRTKSAIFQGRPKCPLLVGLCIIEQTYTMLYRFLGTHTLYATRQTLTATNRQIVRTPNLNATSFGRPFCGRWLTAIHLALCFKSGLLPAMLLSQVLANLCHNQEVTASHRFTGRRSRNAPR